MINSRQHRRLDAVGLVLILSVVPAASCAKNPATGQRQLSLVSEAQEIQLGKQAAQEVEQTLGFVDKPDLQSYVNRVGQQIAKGSERPALPWEFHVVDDATPNAFALPGGFIYVTRGLTNLLTSEAQLAGVLGHEVAHVTARHSVNQISKQQLTQLGLGLGGVLFPAVEQLSPILGTGLNLLFLKYGRDDEREADTIGFRYVNQQGWAVSEFGEVFLTLQRANKGESGHLPDWLSTHPSDAERVERARAMAAQAPPNERRIGRDTFLRQIDGLVYGQDPRQGFFREDVFYHPELQFQLQFPRGWQHQNFARAVVGVASDQTAALELTLVPSESAELAMRRFASQSGIEVGQPVADDFGGLRGLRAEFTAGTADQRVRGVVAYIEQRGRVYQIVGYSAAANYDATAPVLLQSIKSFRPVTDPSILSVKPNRIEIVEVKRAQTLGEFAKQFPSAVPVEELAIINHVPDASARLEAGTLVKRVVG